MTSREKITEVVMDLAAAQPPPMNTLAQSIAATKLAELPEDPAELDARLVAHAELLLALRSDGAAEARVVVEQEAPA